MGRFISADGYTSTGQGLLGNNMFAYCGNNPVNMSDPSGEFGLLAGLVVGAIVGVVSQYVGEVIGNVIEGKQGSAIFEADGTIADYAGAALSGMVAATGIGLAGSIIANVGISTTTYLVNCGINNEAVSAKDAGWAIGMGVISGFIGGSGVDVGGKGAIFDIADDVIKNSSSLKKVAMYTAKKIAAGKGLVEGTIRTIGSIIVPNALTATKDTLLD